MKRALPFTIASLLLLLITLYATASWVGAGFLLMPPRNPPQQWQATMTSQPQKFGMCIEHGVTTTGMPYLLCLPDPATGPGQRGEILRRQLGGYVKAYGEVTGTIVLLHGWGMRKESLLAVAERFCAAGLRCVIPDLPGHGENPLPAAGFGARPAEQLLPCEALDSAARQFHFPPQPALLWGLSMGGAYALQAASGQPERWSGVVVVSSFDALLPVVCGRIDAKAHGLAAFLDPGLALAVRWRGGFWPGDARPLEFARHLSVPALVLHGTADDLIPPSSGRRIYNAIHSPRKKWLAVDGALHGNVLGTPQHVFAAMSKWLLASLPAKPEARSVMVKHSP